MGILQFPKPIPATNGNLPNLRFMVATDNLATVTTAGYLNSTNLLDATPLSNGDVVMALYGYSTTTTTGTFGIFTVAINTATTAITLSEWTGTSGIVLPTIANNIIVSLNTSGQLGNLVGTAINQGSIQAGTTAGIAGALSSYPNTANEGYLSLQANTNSAGNFHTEITTATSVAQNQVITVPDSGAATANFMLNTGATVMVAGSSITMAKVNGTEAANAVTASGVAGAITTSSLTTAGAASYAITWTNTFITATSVVLLTIAGGTNTTENITLKCVPGASSATLTIYNNTAATALNGTIIINYLVM